MNSDWSLRLIAAIAGFLLKTSLAFVLCAALSRLVEAARFRFIVWSTFVYGSAAYWLYLALVFRTSQTQPAILAPVALHAAAASFTSILATWSSLATWRVPSSWSSPLELLLHLAGIAYLVILGGFIVSHLRKRHHLRWVLSFASEPDADTAETFRCVARELHTRRSRLLLLPGATSPATFGWFRPIVLLPSACIADDRLELEDIFRHELHHVRRGDAIWNELAAAARGLLFFHPAVWYAVARMQFDRELACDLAVIARSPGRRAEYAECLVRFARLNVVPEQSGWGIDFAASARHLTVRVRSILAASKSSPDWVRCLRVASGAGIAALFFGVAPSLAVLLSFAHAPLSSETARSFAQTSPNGSAKANKSGRRTHFAASPAKGHPSAAGKDTQANEESRPELELQADTTAMASSSLADAGPQLRHRGDPPVADRKGAVSQTITLTDTDVKGQPIKSSDSQQTVQQTATAALGIYKRISAVDRH